MIFFVTPAWQRFDLTDVCMRQRKQVIDQLAKDGIEARCVVIADDANLDIARGLGFDTVETDNDHGLGRKFNDGYEYAVAQGATWIVPIGSDSWIDPAFFLPLPTERPTRVRSSHLYAAATYERMVVCNVATERCPAGPYMFHRDLLARANYRPTEDDLYRNLDSSTISRLQPFRWVHRDDHPLQYVGFRHPKQHITSYDRLRDRWGVEEYTDHWDRLKEVYDPVLVEDARRAITP